jgi:hypothetical protein
MRVALDGHKIDFVFLECGMPVQTSPAQLLTSKEYLDLLIQEEIQSLKNSDLNRYIEKSGKLVN